MRSILGAYNETKSENISRTLAMMEDELTRTGDRVVLAETRVVDVEAELQNIGENQKQLEVSEEKARQREEKYQGDICGVNSGVNSGVNRGVNSSVNRGVNCGVNRGVNRGEEMMFDISRSKSRSSTTG